MKIIRLIIILFTVFTLTACVSIDTRLKREFAKISRGPAGSPYKTITNFSSSLQCMDKLMLDQGISNIPILIEAIDDKTEAVNAGTRDMLISAISEMTIRSHAIKMIAYGQDSANLISFMKTAKNSKAFKQVPLFDIQGSISQHDEDVISTGNSLGLFSRREGGGGYAKSAALSTIAMDLNVLNAGDMSVVPGVSARNSISILSQGKSFDADATINKFGIYFDISLNRTEGKTQALRNLVELSAIELIGKLVKVPYWQCLGASDQKAHQTANKHLFAQSLAANQQSEKQTQTTPRVTHATHKVASPMIHPPQRVSVAKKVVKQRRSAARENSTELMKKNGIRIYTQEVSADELADFMQH
jgi:hypothetical protein